MRVVVEVVANLLTMLQILVMFQLNLIFCLMFFLTSASGSFVHVGGRVG